MSLLAIAGVCGSGKTTLVQGLTGLGIEAHSVAQEHSFAPKMWQMRRPELLIVLDCSLETVCLRRQVNWSESVLTEQRFRLRHAREHCNLLINTDTLSIQSVLAWSLQFLKEVNAIGGDIREN